MRHQTSLAAIAIVLVTTSIRPADARQEGSYVQSAGCGAAVMGSEAGDARGICIRPAAARKRVRLGRSSDSRRPHVSRGGASCGGTLSAVRARSGATACVASKAAGNFQAFVSDLEFDRISHRLHGRLAAARKLSSVRHASARARNRHQPDRPQSRDSPVAGRRDRAGGAARPSPRRCLGKRGRRAFRASERISDAICAICSTPDGRLRIGAAWRGRSRQKPLRAGKRPRLTTMAQRMPVPTPRKLRSPD